MQAEGSAPTSQKRVEKLLRSLRAWLSEARAMKQLGRPALQTQGPTVKDLISALSNTNLETPKSTIAAGRGGSLLGKHAGWSGHTLFPVLQGSGRRRRCCVVGGVDRALLVCSGRRQR